MSTDNGMAFSLLFLSGAERQRKRRSRYRGTTLDLSPAFSLKAGRFPQTHIKPRREDNLEDVSASSEKPRPIEYAEILHMIRFEFLLPAPYCNRQFIRSAAGNGGVTPKTRPKLEQP